MSIILLIQDFDSWFDTNNCLGDQKLVERLHMVSVRAFCVLCLPKLGYNFSNTSCDKILGLRAYSSNCVRFSEKHKTYQFLEKKIIFLEREREEYILLALKALKILAFQMLAFKALQRFQLSKV